MEWDRKSELSADRAGLLCAQDTEAAYRSLMRIAGGRFEGQLNLDAFIKQAEEYEAAGDTRDAVLKVLNLIGRSHPFPVLRLAHLKKWVESGEYEAMLNGSYKTRSSDTESDEDEHLTAATKAEGSSDEEPLARIMKSIGDRMTGAGQLIRGHVRDLLDSTGRKNEEDAGDEQPDPEPKTD